MNYSQLRALPEKERNLLSAALTTYEAALRSRGQLEEEVQRTLKVLHNSLRPYDKPASVLYEPKLEEGVLLIRVISVANADAEELMKSFLTKRGVDVDGWEITETNKVLDGTHLVHVAKNKKRQNAQDHTKRGKRKASLYSPEAAFQKLSPAEQMEKLQQMMRETKKRLEK